MPDAEVDALAKEVVDWYIEWNPIFATYVGIHDHDHRLPIGTYDAELEERARVKEFLRRVESIDRTGLSAGKRVDLGNLRNVFRIWSSSPRKSARGNRCLGVRRRSETRCSRSSCVPSRRCRGDSRALPDDSNGRPAFWRRPRGGFEPRSRSGARFLLRRRNASPASCT